jgi:hypothetical protein
LSFLLASASQAARLREGYRLEADEGVSQLGRRVLVDTAARSYTTRFEILSASSVNLDLRATAIERIAYFRETNMTSIPVEVRRVHELRELLNTVRYRRIRLITGLAARHSGTVGVVRRSGTLVQRDSRHPSVMLAW